MDEIKGIQLIIQWIWTYGGGLNHQGGWKQHSGLTKGFCCALFCSGNALKNKSPTSPLLSPSLKHSQRVYSSSSLQLLYAGRWGSTGLAPQPSPDHRGPAPFHLLHPRPQHPLCQLLSTFGPRRLPLEPGGWRGSVRFLRHIWSWRSVVELRYKLSRGWGN